LDQALQEYGPAVQAWEKGSLYPSRCSFEKVIAAGT
ncbi:hypothetical protein BAE44_0016717, partial [Dichanthelium oligosanthes]